ncbi:DUF6879 family protein, partial [Streptacidiphilus sp. MAP5-3]|uniref:DUF6879 family protein n=1 Tax=unclassified Streptacidiphilus TaxID=2643834 RepID=UPI00351335E7
AGLLGDLTDHSGRYAFRVPSRNRSTGLEHCSLLPGNDLWVFDNDLVRFHQFSGIGAWIGPEMRQEPALVQQTLTAFEQLWERATDHGDYQLI